MAILPATPSQHGGSHPALCSYGFVHSRTPLHIADSAEFVNARVILRRNNFDPPLSSSFFFQQLTLSKVLSHVCCAIQQIVRLPHPAADRLHLDRLWWTVGAETSERGIYCRAFRARSSRLPSLPQPVQVVRPAAPNASTRSLRMPAEQGLSTLDHSSSLRTLRKPGCARVR